MVFLAQRHLMISGNDALMTYRGHSVLHTLVRAKFSPVHTTGQVSKTSDMSIFSQFKLYFNFSPKF